LPPHPRRRLAAAALAAVAASLAACTLPEGGARPPAPDGPPSRPEGGRPAPDAYPTDPPPPPPSAPEAVELPWSCGDAAVVEALEAAAAGRDARLRRLAAEFLPLADLLVKPGIRPRESVLEDLLRDPDPMVRRLLASSLGDAESPRARRWLRSLRNDPGHADDDPLRRTVGTEASRSLERLDRALRDGFSVRPADEPFAVEVRSGGTAEAAVPGFEGLVVRVEASRIALATPGEPRLTVLSVTGTAALGRTDGSTLGAVSVRDALPFTRAQMRAGERTLLAWFRPAGGDRVKAWFVVR
jgi:HEAT repeat protein